MVEEGSPGRLFVVSTPIGNLGDLTHRAVEVLRAVDVVLAEDTRHSRRLLDHYGVRTGMEAHHEHNEARSTASVLARMREGTTFALVTDAGTPLVSDPGARLVRAVVDAGLDVIPVPGPSAVLAALVGAGLPAERFTFFGFLARKGKERSAALGEIASLPHTAVLYEAPGRVADTVAALAGAAGAERRAVVARELTKQFEEFRRGTLGELAAYYNESPVRGEVVIVVEGRAVESLDEGALRAHAKSLREQGLSARDIATRLAESGAPRNLAYRLAHE